MPKDTGSYLSQSARQTRKSIGTPLKSVSVLSSLHAVSLRSTVVVRTQTQTQTQMSNGVQKPALISPSELCHVVLRTTTDKYQAMIDFYCTFLGGHVTHGNSVLSFLTYDHEHHRIAISARPSTSPKPSGEITGLAHIAFGFRTLKELARSYEEKKAMGMLPVWAVNHGMSTSMYYEDPDGNELELQVDNFDTTEEAIEFMNSDAFERNPVGVDYDPEIFVRRVRSDESDKAIKSRPEIGRRDKR